MGVKSVTKYFKMFDLYGESVGFTIDKGNEKYRTVIGAVLSIVVLAAVASQSIVKFEVLVNRSDTNYQEFLVDQEENKVLTFENTNFNLAFAYSYNGVVAKNKSERNYFKASA